MEDAIETGEESIRIAEEDIPEDAETPKEEEKKDPEREQLQEKTGTPGPPRLRKGEETALQKPSDIAPEKRPGCQEATVFTSQEEHAGMRSIPGQVQEGEKGYLKWGQNP
ncbi:hypothetical protein NDU88_009069 [Pleurodeles waltl]|uniref:Uncharacterized protein n=1 Tax=Pleurodeles waltl TaxID=8319 RepID=A0AAV7RV20_PLEWA|nr:hypothetical protein NDU88_009069 [Pleurodeles waltl]